MEIGENIMYGYIILGFMCAGLSLTNWLQFTNHEAYVEKTSLEIASLESANKDMNERVLKLVLDGAKDQKELLQVGIANSYLVKEVALKNSKLDSYKKRENIALAKPRLVAKLANKAADKVSKEISCVTGDTDSCGSKK